MKNTTILIVENEALIRSALVSTLTRADYRCLEAASAEAALEILTTQHVDLAIVDRMLPGMSGDMLIIRAKEEGVKTAMFVLTGFKTEESLHNDFQNGAVEYMSKPYSTTELLARIRARLRERMPTEPVIRWGKVRFDTRNDRITHDALPKGEEIRLLPICCRILEALIRNNGERMPIGELIEIAYGEHDAVSNTALATNISRINSAFRQKHLNPIVSPYRKDYGYALLPQ